MNIYQKVNQVMQEVAYVQKDAQVQNYKAVTHDKVTAALRKSMVSAGIVVVVDQLDGKVLKEWATKNGALFHRYAGDYMVSLVNTEDATDRIAVKVQAHADDNADKAPGKAMSYATKYAMLKTFSLETGENEESRYQGIEPATEAPEGVVTAIAEAADMDALKAAFADSWKKYPNARKALTEAKEARKKELANAA